MSITTDGGLVARLRRTVAELDRGFCKLNRIRFAAPWKPRRSC